MTLPMSGTDELSGPFNTAFDQIREGFHGVVENFNKIIEKINHWAWAFGAAAWLWIKHSISRVRELMDTIKEKVEYAFQHQFPVLSLITTSFMWVTDVKKPVSELSFPIKEPEDQNFAKWTGDAASYYGSKADKQKAAVDESVLKSEFVSQWLFKIAKSNVDFIVSLAKVVTKFLKDIIVAAEKAGTVIDIPFAINTLADSSGDLLKETLDLAATIGQRFVEALGNVRDLATQVGDHSKLPGGNWPEAVRG